MEENVHQTTKPMDRKILQSIIVLQVKRPCVFMVSVYDLHIFTNLFEKISICFVDKMKTTHRVLPIKVDINI